MKIFANQGFREFVIATGYKSEIIESWVDSEKFDNWDVQAVFTGQETQTAGRIKRCMDLFPGEPVIATYGDGLGNVNIKSLLAFHDLNGGIATITAVRPPSRFGVLDINDGKVEKFDEKKIEDAGWINGGFFALKPEIANLISGDQEIFEKVTLPNLALSNDLFAYKHSGFWKPMDSLREKLELEKLADTSEPPWLQNI